MDDPVRQIGVLVDDVEKALVGGDDGILLRKREREVETIVSRMIEIARQTRRRSGEIANCHGNR